MKLAGTTKQSKVVVNHRRCAPVALASALLLLLMALPAVPAWSLTVNYEAADKDIRAVVEATLPARRLAELETPTGYAFWARRLSRDGAKALESLGFYAAKITVDLDAQNSVQVRVDPGRPTQVADITLTFAGLPESATPPAPGLKRGERLDHRVYENDKRQIHSWLISQGYLNARIETHRIEINRQMFQANIVLSWKVGTQFRFGKTLFMETTLAPEFLQRYVQYQEGDALKEDDLQKLSRNLRSSGYFNNVELVPQIEQADELGLVPVQVRLQAAARSIYEAGISIGTDRGPGVDVGMKRSRSNTMGHRWEAKGDVSSRRQFLAGRYEMPSALSMDRTRLLDLNVVNERTDSSDRTTTRAAVSLQKSWLGWRRTDALNVLHERYTVADDTLNSTLLVGSLELFRREADDMLNPGHGWRARGELSGSTTAVGSSTNFVRAEVNAKYVNSIGSSIRWLARARFGALWTDDFTDLPSSLRFYAGGDHSVRGFDFESLGPRDELNNVLGGQRVIETSFEVDYLFAPQWRVAIFYDAGNAFGDGEEELEYSAGAGIRWLSPIGPLRLDVASALSEPDNGIRIHFSAGPDL